MTSGLLAGLSKVTCRMYLDVLIRRNDLGSARQERKSSVSAKSDNPEVGLASHYTHLHLQIRRCRLWHYRVNLGG